MRVTIKEIARELGISHSTVSRVLNEKQSAMVSEATRERILQTATRMGYRPNRLAQALQGGRTNLVGVFMPDEDNWFFQEVLCHLRKTVEQNGCELIQVVSADPQRRADWQRLLGWDLDGVFSFDYMLYVDGLWEAMTLHRGTIPPIVGLFSHVSRLQDYVSVDFNAAVRGLMEHLWEQGCRQFAYMGPTNSFHPNEQRFSVFDAFVRERGVRATHLCLPRAADFREAARLGTQTYLQSGDPLPDAICCQNDEMALGCYRALCAHGIRVPEQVCLSGCDNIPYPAYLETPLTTLALPIGEVCQEAWRILQTRIAEPEGAPLHSILEAELLLRASTRF